MKARQNTQVLLFASIILVNAMFAGLVYQWFFYDCMVWTCVPIRPFVVAQLDISEEFFPEGARFGRFSQPSDLSGAIEDASKTVFWNEGYGHAFYMVRRFGRLDIAEREFQRVSSSFYQGISNIYVLSDMKLHVDEYQIYCGNGIVYEHTCLFTGRYEEYLATFSVTIDANMSEQEFLSIVSVIDNKIICSLKQECV